MEIPAYQPFYLHTPDDLRAEVERLGLELPLTDDFSPLARRFCAQPIASLAASASGEPTEHHRERYSRLAAGDFRLVWLEATAAGSDAPPGQLRLGRDTLAAFQKLASETRAANPRAQLILQLTVPFRPLGPAMASDIEEAAQRLISGARLAAEAGFHGIDLQCSHGSLAHRLLSLREPIGAYGGSFAGRARFLLETLAAIRETAPGLLLAVRLCAYDAAKGGFGVSADDYRQADASEPIRLARQLHEIGVSLLNVTAASPNLRAASAVRANRPHADCDPPDEHPLTVLRRQLDLASALKSGTPALSVIASGWSWLRHLVPHVAAAAVRAGKIDFIGLGRGALADPVLPTRFAGPRPCIVCFACTSLHESGQPVRCLIHEPPTAPQVFQPASIVNEDQLLTGAQRCHFCEHVPCIRASPTGTDIPGFIQAWLEGDEVRAYEIVRTRDPLPELTAAMAPAWLESEGACVETVLTGTPVPIRALQHALARRARARGLTRARFPRAESGRRVAVVGGGPAGLAATLRLLEDGHTVCLYEQSDRLGGVPALLLPGERSGGFLDGIETDLQEALAMKRLRVTHGASLGQTVHLPDLRREDDAVLLATGLWQERTLGPAPGVIGSLRLLELARREMSLPRPRLTILLAGGDSAMDAACLLLRLESKILLVCTSPLSELHWHGPDSFFRDPRVETMPAWQPLAYVPSPTGGAVDLRLRHLITGQETVVSADLVVEAMGLERADALHLELADFAWDAQGRYLLAEAGRTSLPRVYAAGALINGGASVGRCIAEGLAAARSIHEDFGA